MIRLGFSEFIRNMKRNMLIIIQMVAVYVIALFTVSAFVEQYRLLGGISDVFDDTGLVIINSMAFKDEMLNRDELEDMLVSVETIEIPYNFKLNKNGYSIKVTSCNSKNISYRPELVKGEWCEDATHEEGVINAVISEDMPFAKEIGDIVEIDGFTFKITGFVGNNEMIYGTTSRFKYTEANYLSFYEPLSEMTDVNGGLIIVSYEDLQKYHQDKLSFPSYWSMLLIIDFADDITDEEIEYNMKQITERYGYTQGGDMVLTDEMYEYSWRIIMLKIMPMLMLLAVIIVVLIVSLVISGTINVLYERRNYGIYFICGNNWKNTFKFSLVNWTIMAVASIALAVGVCVLIYSKKLIKGLILSFTGMHILAILGITVAMLLFAVFIPYVKLRRIQPVSILKENDK